MNPMEYVSPEPYKLYINGQYVAAEKGNIVDVINPANNQPFAKVYRGTKEDCEKAIQAARKERTPAEEKKRDKKLIAIVVGGFAAALLVVFLLFKFVFSGINDNPAAQSYKVPDVLGKTVEEAQQMEASRACSRSRWPAARPTATISPARSSSRTPSPAMSARIT